MSKCGLALITGASRGIGLAIAKKLIGEGYAVIGTATSESGANFIEKELGEDGVEVHGLVLNVSNKADIETFLKQLTEKQLSPSILINNAGITRDNLLLRMKDEEWNDVINANLNSIFLLTKGLIKPMIKARFGRIISVTSVVGGSGNAGQSNYSAAKAGVIGFTKSLAREVAKRGITVNAVSPGFINTDMTKKLTDTQKEATLSQIPLGRVGEASEIAAAVCFLASNEAGYITGETLNVNGGMQMI
ncbi:MAG: 3-oxoacyl-ACP reductase FabG [Gammaproteobacteria bacterium]|jgi:3-oxoacyl-[acyl-carrier protein] reductase|nr:3-oxoacyl-ACP reductase FabG [Pseudomonadota bacterium]MDG2302903.1 3-oxoacyl-ACP reductase FabG [Gammaproteobacteria bacterium]MBT5066530.1 3-oxoacyl-ACP reductase FabG [Pseudomonadota bacterium]MBT6194172.1 3-oxoacyl-ACP reductase FabG [Pseudomonadota bacterium]MBT6465457.1 3-oxoacyl-ACP reductase FabG [Pseudomonadota bacterium]